MIRCKNGGGPPWLGRLCLSALLAAPLAQAQDAAPRRFPDSALRGELVVTAPPQVLLDGRNDLLSPGARILAPNNLLVLSGGLVGQTLVVNYTRNPQGQLHEVWILRPEERRERRATAAGGRSFNWPTWLGGSPPTPRDDGRTPYHALPGYPGQQP